MNDVTNENLKKILEDDKEEIELAKLEEVLNNNNLLSILLIVQIMFIMASIFFAVLSITMHEFLPATELFLGMSLIVMAYNNSSMYKKQKSTILYLVFGIIFFILFIWGIKHGI